MEGVKCVGVEGWMWVVGACLCFYSVQVFADVHCVCVCCVVVFVCCVCIMCVVCFVCYVCVCVICVCVCVRVCVCVCTCVVCVLCGVNVCGERGGGVWKE